jgi:hypothetical protein
MVRVLLLAIVASLFLAAAAHADINGFGDFSNFTINNGDGGAAPTLNIPTGTINLIVSALENRSIFCNTPQSTSNFTASFTFRGLGENNTDGTYFVLQNNALGTHAVNFSGMGTSAAVGILAWPGTGFYSNGNASGFTSTGALDVFSGHPINVSLSYNGSILTENLLDTTTLASFSNAYPANIPALVGGSTALVGFSSSANFGTSQSISDFQFHAIPEPATLSLLFLAAFPVLSRRRRVCGFQVQG